MKKIISSFIILIIVIGCNNRQRLHDDRHPTTIIPGQYIVIMKDAFEEPVINHRQNDPNRATQRDKNKRERDRKEKKVKDFLKGKEVGNAKQKMLFADAKVGAVIRVDQAKADEINADPNVEFVIPDATIQINPIQQSEEDAINPIQQWLSPIVPADQINPIQQDDALQTRYDIDIARHWTNALVAAGGPTDGSAKTSVIWFLDTGIDPTGGLLNVNTVLATHFIGSSWTDDNGHGTFCAGVAAGRFIRGSAVLDEIHYGVSEGATVVPVKVLDGSGSGTWGTVIAGLNYVAQLSQAGDVVNLSLGSYYPGDIRCHYPALERAISGVANSGVFVTLSAGNNAGNAMSNRPGCINGPNIFTVSSINADGSCAGYANFGTPVDFVTVGTRLFSLWTDGGYRMASGTSVSSALLAGIIHASGGPPATGGTVNCMGVNYPIGIRR